MGRWIGRLGALLAGLVTAVAVAGVAYAHVEVEADPAVAGAENAVVTFDAEAESGSAGVESVRVVLPEGITAADVTLDSGPDGWSITPDSDGYTIGGPALPVGDNAVHSIVVARLPDASELVFKVLVNYTDGSVDRWIEEPSEANPEPPNPAAVLELAANPNAAPQPSTASPTAAPTTPAALTATPGLAAAPQGGGSGWLWWVLAVILVVGGGAAYLLLRRRPGAGPPASGTPAQ